MYMYDAKAIEKAAALVKNFLNYVLAHDACPEHTANIMAARNVCDIAPQEMRATHELLAELPGSFNGAASSLFCNSEGEGRLRGADNLTSPDNFDQWVIFRLTVLEVSTNTTARAKLASLDAGDASALCAIDTQEREYEVREVRRPRVKYKKMLEEQLLQQGLGGDAVKPAGRAVLGPAIIAHGRHGAPRPDEVEADLAAQPGEEFLLEDGLLAKLEPGMKLRLVTCGLALLSNAGGKNVEQDLGLRFIKEALDARVSFDTFLPQSLMVHWRDPVPNERPAPSVTNPGAEEKAANALAGAGDLD